MINHNRARSSFSFGLNQPDRPQTQLNEPSHESRRKKINRLLNKQHTFAAHVNTVATKPEKINNPENMYQNYSQNKVQFKHL